MDRADPALRGPVRGRARRSSGQLISAVSISVTGSSHDPAVLTEGFQSAFLVGACFAIAGLFATLLLIRSADSRAHVELGSEPATAG